MISEEEAFKKVCAYCRDKGNEGKLCDNCPYIKKGFNNRDNENLGVMEFE